MRDTASRLVRAGYAIYGVDHEGHGRSSGLRCYIPNFGDVIDDCSSYFKSVCDKPENREKKRFLYRISMGGSVALLLHRKEPAYWDGAVLLAPMCKISDDMKPHPVVVSALKMVCAVAPSWRIIPTPDILDKVCKDPEMRKQVLQLLHVRKKKADHSY
nr:caffeoylshikimate esterase-like [Lolium perenne]